MMKRFGLVVALALGVTLGGCGDSSQPAAKQNAPATQPAPTPVVARVVPPQVKLADNILATNELLLLDNSGSMDHRDKCTSGETRFFRAIEALIAHIKRTKDDVNQALAVFSGSTARIVVPFGAGSAHREKLLRELKQLSANQGTPLYGALKFSYEAMQKQMGTQLGYGTYRIVVVTDGASMDYNPAPLAKEIVMKSPIEVHTIGFCLGAGHSLDIPDYTKYYAADNPKALADGLLAVQAETTAYQPVTTFGR